MINLNNKNLLYFRFKRLKNNKIFLSNDIGERVLLDYDVFIDLIKGNYIDKKLENLLISKMFLKHPDITENEQKLIMAGKRVIRNKHILNGPMLHIIVVTLNCNYGCKYCHASSVKGNSEKYKMSKDIAKKTIDTIFQTTSGSINIEFQGGEPLMNWEVVKYIIEYTKEKNQIYNLNLKFSLVSNFSLMDENKMKFLVDNDVGITTSLDGPKELNDYNRPFIGGTGSFDIIIKWIRKINEYMKQSGKKRGVGIITTATKKSLPYYKEIVDTYIEYGLNSVFIRPVNPYGFAKKDWEELGINQQEYIDFYDKILNYINEKKNQGVDICDIYSDICKHNLTNSSRAIFTEELGPLCGAVLKQVAYNRDGGIYSCDEGRMLGDTGDYNFKIGEISKDKSGEEIYKEFISNVISKLIMYASMIDFLPGYNTNPITPYIGVCPIYNYCNSGKMESRYKKDGRLKLQNYIVEKNLSKINQENEKNNSNKNN